MLGRKELAKLDRQKQTLVLESDLHRLALRAEIQSLHSATAWMGEATSLSRELSPLLVVLAPLAGFLLARGSRRADSWLSRLITLAKWVAPLYRLWKSFTARRGEPDAGTPAA